MPRDRLRYLAIIAHAKAKRLARIAAERKAEQGTAKPVVEKPAETSLKQN